MAKTDRVILVTNDQSYGQTADPNKLEAQITHAFDKIDENDNEFVSHKKEVDPTSADTNRNKHVANNDLKVLQDQITTNLTDLTDHKKQVDPTSSDTARNKHVSNNDLKTLQDQITTNDTASNSRDNTHKGATVLDHPDQSVTTEKLKDLAVTSGKIAVGAVGRTQLDPTLFEQTANASKFQEIDAQLAQKSKQLEDVAISLGDYAKGDGTDETIEITNGFMDIISKGKTILIPEGKTFVTNGILIENKSNISIIGLGILKLKNGATQTLLRFNNCTDINITTINLDGNVINNGGDINEFLHLIKIHECQRVTIGSINGKNPCGDVLCIDGNTSDAIQINSVRGIADSYCGRNCVSIIKGHNIQIGSIYSYKIGKKGMPSGLDIESNAIDDVIRNVTVNSLIVHSIGTGGIGITNTSGGLIENIKIKNAFIFKHNEYDNTVTVYAIQVVGSNVKKVDIDAYVEWDIDTTGASVYLQGDRINLNIVSYNSRQGLSLGYTNPLTNFKITGEIRKTSSHGIVVYEASKGVVDMKLKEISSSRVLKSSQGVSDNVRFSGDYSKETVGSKCFSDLSGAVLTNWQMDTVDFTGWGNNEKIYGNSFLDNVTKYNCKNLNYRSSIPTGDYWTKGDEIINTNPIETGAAGSKYIVEKFKCITSGNPGTWVECRVLTGN